MGFYGNITNTARTQFQFDKTYPNKVEMERAQLRDGIYLGRYILIEYDNEHHRDSYERVWFKDGYPTTAYKSDKYESNTAIKNGEAEDNPIVVVYGEKEDKFYAWQKPENYDSRQDANKIAVYDEIVSSNDLQYTINYTIDLNAYKVSRGYDSTVWQKVYSDGVEKYVMIAELNTVVPTFDVSADAPTMSPITPHFDTRSTDVYYKLHWQAPWGFRLAAADSENQSDLKTQWVRHSYNKDNGTTIPEYYYPDQEEWKVDKPANDNINAAIYFNAAGFEEDTPSYVKGINNEIKITLGQSGNEYNKHDGSIDVEAQDDTQELTINLPGIGNMMSKAWDIIHGPNRDNSMAEFELNEDGSKKLDENGKPIRVDSLQGRLDSIAVLGVDEIPIKRDSDGSLIGSKVNGGKIPGQMIDLTGIDDDAWIRTVVDHTTQTINIHHKFDDNKNGNTISDLRQKIKNNGNTKDTADDIDLNDEGDNFTITTPIVDSMGHVVAKNTETVTLPYGFKTISVTNKSESTDEMAATAGNVVAYNSKDILKLTPGNKWIHIAPVNTVDNNEIKLGHEVNSIDIVDSTATNLNDPISNIINIPDWDYDVAGHIIAKKKHEYILPFGYKTFTDSDGSSSTANSTQDTMTIQGDSWIQAKAGNDTLLFAHADPVSTDTIAKNDKTLFFGDTFTIDDHYFDDKGHKFESKYHTIKIPQVELKENVEPNEANVITQLSFTNSSGTLDISRTNISKLKLTGYEEVDEYIGYGEISAEDTLGYALGHLQNQIKYNQDQTDEAILLLKDKDGEINNSLNNALQKIDSALQLDSSFIFNRNVYSIRDLFELIINLSTKVTELENKVNAEHPTSIEPEIPENTIE